MWSGSTHHVAFPTLYTVPNAPLPSTLPCSSAVSGVMMRRVASGGNIGGRRVWGRGQPEVSQGDVMCTGGKLDECFCLRNHCFEHLLCRTDNVGLQYRTVSSG